MKTKTWKPYKFLVTSEEDGECWTESVWAGSRSEAHDLMAKQKNDSPVTWIMEGVPS
ncbi:MAG TPA: hypothetical protein VF974_08120 [Patescibacteria group bacterium]